MYGHVYTQASITSIAQDVNNMIIVIVLWVIGIFVAFHMLCGIVNIATGRDPGTGEKNAKR